MRASVIRLAAGDNSRSPGDSLRKLERGFICLCSGIHKVAAVERGGKEADEFSGQAVGRRLDVFSVGHHMQVFVHLVLDGLYNLRMTMPNIADGYPGDHVHVPGAIRTVQVYSFCPFHSNAEGMRRRLREAVKKRVFVEVHGQGC